MINLQLDFMENVCEFDLFNSIKLQSENFEIISITKYLNGHKLNNFKLIIYDNNDSDRIISFLKIRFGNLKVQIKRLYNSEL